MYVLRHACTYVYAIVVGTILCCVTLLTLCYMLQRPIMGMPRWSIILTVQTGVDPGGFERTLLGPYSHTFNVLIWRTLAHIWISKTPSPTKILASSVVFSLTLARIWSSLTHSCCSWVWLAKMGVVFGKEWAGLQNFVPNRTPFVEILDSPLSL